MTTPKLLTHDQLRAALEPHIRKAKISLVAEQAGISHPSLSGWVNGRRALSDETLARVARAVGFEVLHGYLLRKIH